MMSRSCPLASVSIFCTGTYYYPAVTCFKCFFYSGIPVDDASGWEIGCFDVFYYLGNFNIVVVDVGNTCVNSF